MTRINALFDIERTINGEAAERAPRGICLARKSWLFAASDRGCERAAVMYTLTGTAKLNDVDPQALARRLPRPHRRDATDLAARVPSLALNG